MAANYANNLYKDYEELMTKFDALTQKFSELKKTQEKEIKKLKNEHQKEIKKLENKVEYLKKENEKLKEENNTLKLEILRIKDKNSRDSSNSSKPSSTNGFKNVPTNGRETSDKKPGAQKGHKGAKLDNKLEQFLNSGNVIERIVEINKNESNKNKRYIVRKSIDLQITKVITTYRYYPDENGKYNIPKCHNQNVVYGPVVKAICTDLMNHLPNSTDSVTNFIEDITNCGMTISKGTLILWNEELANRFKPIIKLIEEALLDAYYINHDESQIKVNGEGQNILCACNKKYVRLWVHEHKSQKALKEIGFLPNYKGDNSKRWNRVI